MKTPIKQKIEGLKSGWYVWIFPLIALGVCAWFYYQYTEQKGPLIQISFEDASGLQPEKTMVRFRGVEIGLLKKVVISEDNKNAVATVALRKEAQQFSLEGAKFWIVVPKVNFQGISGLETLIEGTYIAALPGKENGVLAHEFKGQIGSESSDPLEDTVPFTLETNNLGSINSGDSVTFRGLNIGSVTKISLSKTSQTIFVQINIQKKYVKLIRTNTVFWRKMAVQAQLGLFKTEIKLGALDTLLHGGIDLFTPEPAGEIAKYQSKFPLLAGPPKDYEKWNPKLEF